MAAVLFASDLSGPPLPGCLPSAAAVLGAAPNDPDPSPRILLDVILKKYLNLAPGGGSKAEKLTNVL